MTPYVFLCVILLDYCDIVSEYEDDEIVPEIRNQ